MDLKKALLTSGKFDVIDKHEGFVARRRRILPLRGLFRILFPLSIVRGNAEKLSVRPDGWGWLILFICIMGVVIEFPMPRARYPRNYPPVFVFAITGVYIFNMLFDLYLTQRTLRGILSKPA